MARWRGIFGRKGKREGEPDATNASTDAGDDPVTALYPTSERPPAGPPEWAPHDTGDREQVAEPGPRPPVPRPLEPDTGTADWAPPSPVSSRRRPAVEDEPPSEEMDEVEEPPSEELEVAEAPPAASAEAEAEPPAERDPDTGERIQSAAVEAAQAAEMRSHDEILALERNLEQVQSNAQAELEEMAGRLRDAEARSQRPPSAPIGWPPSATRSRRRPAKPRPSGCAGR